jgi:hypothetical protein
MKGSAKKPTHHRPPTHDRPAKDDSPRKTERNDGDADLDDALDEALRDTFPASDPIAVHKRKKKAR